MDEATDPPLSINSSGHSHSPAQDESLLGLAVNNTAVDLDRDANGALLPPHRRDHAQQVFATQISGHRSTTGCVSTPANLYTAPKRIEDAIMNSSFNFRGKQTDRIPPPPAHIYVRSDDPSFNIFTNGFLLYPELCLALASHMPLRDLVSLYSMSKDFHTIIDSRFTTTCLNQALRKAPQSAQTFKFRMYAQFCRKDPAARIPHPNPAKAALSIPRTIPSFSWVAFILHREKVVHELMTVFAEKGCPLPARCCLALKRMWLLMDIPDNARRVAIIHNHRQFTNLDLYFMMCFFVKLDMVANDPVAAEKRDGFRKLLLSQRQGLDVVLKVLKREMWQKQSDIIIAWIRTTMTLGNPNAAQPEEMQEVSIFGVPIDEVGIGKYEYWGLRGVHNIDTGHQTRYLLRPDQLVVREAARRGLSFRHHFLRCLLYGYVRPDTLKSYAPRNYGRRIDEWRDEEYDINDSVGGVRALDVEDGGDPLLDLRDKSRGSKYTVRKEPVSDQEKAMRDGQARLLKEMYRLSETERMS